MILGDDNEEITVMGCVSLEMNVLMLMGMNVNQSDISFSESFTLGLDSSLENGSSLILDQLISNPSNYGSLEPNLSVVVAQSSQFITILPSPTCI